MLPQAQATTNTLEFDDLATRETTRVLLIYSLVNRLGDLPGTRSLSSLMVFGRFATHIEASGELLPKVLTTDLMHQPRFAIADAPVAVAIERLRLLLAVTPRRDSVLVMDVELVPGASVGELARFLAGTCFNRFDATLDGRPLLEWVADAMLDGAGPQRPTLRFGRDVHQMVFPEAAIGALLGTAGSLGEEMTQLVYRGTIRATAALKTPTMLNCADLAVAAHGRGVSVISGWAPHVENSLAVIATTMVSALGVIQRVRRSTFRALKLNESSESRSADEARELVTRLSQRLTDLQLDLGFGVDAFTDSVLIPELIVSDFQSSLRDSVGLTDAQVNTSRMLDRLQSVLAARVSELEASVQGRQERRAAIISYLLAVGTLIALPPALLLAFFGTNSAEVDGVSSMFDLDRYGIAYLVVWCPFVLLIGLAWLLLVRVGRSAKMPPRRDSTAEDLLDEPV